MIRIVLLALLAASFPVPEAVWSWPTEGAHVIIRDYRAPLTPWGAGHRGVDLAASGTRVTAPTSGIVSFSGHVVDRSVVSITTSEGWIISMEPVEPLVQTGQWVSKGDLVGALQEGHCDQLCLHLGLRIEGSYRSARRELGVLQRAVLLPVWSQALG
ncbi:MAG: hypothetical protein RL247_528 [Actinomycetota bacterium]